MPPGSKSTDLDRDLLQDLVPDLDLQLPGDDDNPESADGPLPDELDRAVRNMRDISSRLDEALDEVAIHLKLRVRDFEQLSELLSRLNSVSNVIEARRLRT